MDIKVPAGKYVVAVSGGVDSVVLLHALRTLSSVQLIVAHFDHGIRPDSGQDRLFVEGLARGYGLPFAGRQGQLGPAASEAAARTARYGFLREVRQQAGAQAIITAHHQDDVLETAILNLIRGTGRKGLSSLTSTEEIVRPLLDISKLDIVGYAHQNNLAWHEDSTNQDPKYLRNYIRLKVLPRLNASARQKLLDIIKSTQTINAELDSLLAAQLALGPAGQLPRGRFTQLPHAVSKELLAAWLRANNLREFNTKTLERLTVAAKTGRPGTVANIYKNAILKIGQENLALSTFER